MTSTEEIDRQARAWRLSSRIRVSGRWMPTASHSARQAGKAGHWRNVRQPEPKPKHA